MNSLKYKRISCLVTFIILMLLFFFGVIEFKIFPQAYILYENKTKILSLIFNFHPHLFRYLVVFPSILIGDILKVNVNVVNTLYSILLLSYINYFILEIIEKYIHKINFKIISTTILFIIFLALNINGRIIFAYFGQVLIIKTFLSEKKENIFLIIGIFYSTVSSGVMSVVIISVVFICFFSKKILFHKKIKGKIILLSLLVIFFKYFIIMLEKNYKYFEKNIYKILEHGILNKFYGNEFFNYILFSYVIFFLIYLLIIYKTKIKIIGIFEGISILCGLFGKTTFFMCLIPIFIHINIILFKGRRKNENIKNIILSNILDFRI